MLKAVGIISEYNPFHNGHLYQLRQAKKITNADLTVVVMSGNWVQRGEPAIFDKWSRTRMAIKSGVDLVVELPFQCAVQPADLFAKYAVNILGHLKCDYLSFGCENYHINFKELGNFKIQDSIKNNLKSSMPYASAIREYVFEKTGQSISSPNDILGMNYSVANKSLEHPMQIFPVKRLGAEHDDLKLNIHKNISSASAIRSSIFHKKKNFNDYLPSYYNDFNFDDFINWDDLFPYLKYRIITSSLSDLKQVYQVNEGLEFKLKKEITSSNTFEEFMSKIKSKRYTYARLRRLCCYILVNYKDDAIFDYVRILGFNQTGRTYLKQIKKSVDVPIISRANKKNLNDELKYEYKAGFMISLITHENEDLYRFPLIYK